jgi:pimeloyl-ACP methyl ester carboxylesterase
VLAAADVPVTVIVGAEDTLTPREEAVAMARAREPAAPLHVIAGAGHLSPVEDPDAVADAVRAALT